MNNLVKSVKFTGGIGLVGVFVPQDPGAADALAKKGEIAFDWACAGSRVSISLPGSAM